MNDHEHNQALTAAHELYKAATAREFSEYVAAIKAAHKAYEETTTDVDAAKSRMALAIAAAGNNFDDVIAVKKARGDFWNAVVMYREMYQNTENCA